MHNVHTRAIYYALVLLRAFVHCHLCEYSVPKSSHNTAFWEAYGNSSRSTFWQERWLTGGAGMRRSVRKEWICAQRSFLRDASGHSSAVNALVKVHGPLRWTSSATCRDLHFLRSHMCVGLRVALGRGHSFTFTSTLLSFSGMYDRWHFTNDTHVSREHDVYW